MALRGWVSKTSLWGLLPLYYILLLEGGKDAVVVVGKLKADTS